MRPIHARITLQAAGETFVLLGERAVFRPRRRQLLISDLHLGKGGIFRRSGVALPAGGTSDDLARLSDVLAQEDARSLLILGDLLHGAVWDASWLATWYEWRDAHADVDVAVVTGNHDRGLRESALRVTVYEKAYIDGAFHFRHIPAPPEPGAFGISGHLHPVAAVPGLPRRWPAFVAEERQMILPAFSLFTGGALVSPGPSRRVLACVEGMIVDLPSHDRP